MKRAWWFAVVPGMVVGVVAAFVVALILVELFWAWTVPDLFPEAVRQGLVAKEISMWTALKIVLFVAIMTGAMKASFTWRRKGKKAAS
jgi:hypothetical protein